MTFRRNISSPSSGPKSKEARNRENQTAISPCHMLLLVSCLAYSSTVKMGAICSSKTPGFYRTTRRHNSEDRTLHSHRLENLNSNTVNYGLRCTNVHELLSANNTDTIFKTEYIFTQSSPVYLVSKSIT
jgi:hypothetical protein